MSALLLGLACGRNERFTAFMRKIKPLLQLLNLATNQNFYIDFTPTIFRLKSFSDKGYHSPNTMRNEPCNIGSDILLFLLLRLSDLCICYTQGRRKKNLSYLQFCSLSFDFNLKRLPFRGVYSDGNQMSWPSTLTFHIMYAVSLMTASS